MNPKKGAVSELDILSGVLTAARTRSWVLLADKALAADAIRTSEPRMGAPCVLCGVAACFSLQLHRMGLRAGAGRRGTA